MGTGQSTPLEISSEELEIVSAGDNLFIAILRQTSPEKSALITKLPPAAQNLLSKNEIFVWYNKLVQSISLLADEETVGEEHSVFDAIDTPTVNDTCFITACVPVLDDQPGTFVPAAWLIERIMKISAKITSSSETKLIRTLWRVISVLELLKKHSPEQLGHIQAEQEIALQPFSQYLGEFKFLRELEPFGLTWDDYEASRAVQYPMAYRVMRGYVPTYLLQFSDATDDGRIRKMMKDGLPYDLCHRLLQHKVLWLLSMHPQDVLRLPLAFLSNRTAFDGLDMIELSALWHHLPRWRDLARSVWRARLKLHLDSLVFQEKLHGIDSDVQRHPVYKDDSQSFYDADAALEEQQWSLTAVESAFELSNAELQHFPPQQAEGSSPTPADESDSESSSARSTESSRYPSLATQETYASDMFPMTTALFSLQALSDDHFQRKTQRGGRGLNIGTFDEEDGSDFDDDDDDGDEAAAVPPDADLALLVALHPSRASTAPTTTGTDPWLSPSSATRHDSDAHDGAAPLSTAAAGHGDDDPAAPATEPLSFIDFDLMPDQPFLSTLQDIKLRAYHLHHVGGGDRDATASQASQASTVSSSAASTPPQPPPSAAASTATDPHVNGVDAASASPPRPPLDEDDGSCHTERALRQAAFTVRPQLDRENTFIAKMQHAMMSVVYDPPLDAHDDGDNASPSSTTAPLPTPLPRQRPLTTTAAASLSSCSDTDYLDVYRVDDANGAGLAPTAAIAATLSASMSERQLATTSFSFLVHAHRPAPSTPSTTATAVGGGVGGAAALLALTGSTSSQPSPSSLSSSSGGRGGGDGSGGGQSPPQPPPEPPRTPMTNTRSTLLSLQQDMRRAADEVGDEFDDDAMDIVVALALPLAYRRSAADATPSNWCDDLPTVDEDWSNDDDDDDGGGSVDDSDGGSVDGDAAAAAAGRASRKSATKAKASALSRGVLQEHALELSSFIDAHRSWSPVPAAEAAASTPLPSAPSTGGGLGSRTHSSRRLSSQPHTASTSSGSANRSFHRPPPARRRSQLVESVSSCLFEFLRDDGDDGADGRASLAPQTPATPQPPPQPQPQSLLGDGDGRAAATWSHRDVAQLLLASCSQDPPPTASTHDASAATATATATTTATTTTTLWAALHAEAQQYYDRMATEHALQVSGQRDAERHRLDDAYWQEEGAAVGSPAEVWSRFTASLTSESRSDATYESMVHEYTVELILTGDIDKADAMLRAEPAVVIPVSKATQLLQSMVHHYDRAVREKRTTADPPAIEVIHFLQRRLHAHVAAQVDTVALLEKYYGAAWRCNALPSPTVSS